MKLNPFSAFGPVVSKKLTVAEIVAPIQSAVSKLHEVISQRSESINAAQEQVKTLNEQIEADYKEIDSARAVQEKLKNLLL